MPNGIPDKGRILTQISAFWFDLLGDVAQNHLISVSMDDLPSELCEHTELEGRFMLCRKAEVVPVECVVRGYLAGSGWREYKESGTICGVELPQGLKQSGKLEEPIFTPATKAEEGMHDENISYEQTCEMHGEEMMSELRDTSIELYKRGAEHAEGRGVILADTKFEFGKLPDGEFILIDEVLTPDSSRFWPADVYKPGKDQPSYDKQFVRNYLDSIKFDRTPPAPPLPADIVENTRNKYIEAYKNITGLEFQWE
jgi:phosphoribosylaminoimidazole-succinocarboxamide synthase